MAHWLIQSNASKKDFDEIVAALKRTDSTFSYITIKPFTSEVQGLPHNYKTLPVVLLGTVNLTTWGRKKGLRGVWWNDDFNFEVQRNIFGTEMLNADAEIHPFGGIPHFEGEKFIRPVDDGKAFTGEIIDTHKLAAWQDRIQYFSGDDQIHPATKVLISSVKSIFREYRFFVVKGKVVTGSLYNEDNKLVRRPLWDEDAPVVAYAQAMVDRWTPAEVFVIDIALLNDGTTKIIEINNANACGFYSSDIDAFINAVNEIM